MNGGIWAQIPELRPAGQVQAAGRRHHVGAHGGAVKAEQLSLQEKTIFLWTYLFADQIGKNQPIIRKLSHGFLSHIIKYIII